MKLPKNRYSTLESAMEAAMADIDGAVIDFYKILLSSKDMVVPTAEKNSSNNNSESFSPNFYSFNSEEEGFEIVPIFSSQSLCDNWLKNKPYPTRELSFAQLLNIVPDDWGLILNPASKVEKVITPWEISQLKLGESSIPEIISEIYDDDISGDVSIQEIPTDSLEWQDLKENCINFVTSNAQELNNSASSSVTEMYLVVRVNNSLKVKEILNQEYPEEHLLDKKELILGISLDPKVGNDSYTPLELEELREQLHQLLDPLIIGHNKNLKIMIGAAGHGSVALSLFESIIPFWTKT